LEKARTLNEFLDKIENQLKECFNLLNSEVNIVKVDDLRDILTGQFKKRQTLICGEICGVNCGENCAAYVFIYQPTISNLINLGCDILKIVACSHVICNRHMLLY